MLSDAGSTVRGSRGEGAPCCSGHPAQQFSTPRVASPVETTADTDIRVDGEPAGTGVWGTSLSFCTGCRGWRAWVSSQTAFLKLVTMSSSETREQGGHSRAKDPWGQRPCAGSGALRPHQGSAGSSCPPQDRCLSVPGPWAIAAALGPASAVVHGTTTALLVAGHRPQPTCSPFVAG